MSHVFCRMQGSGGRENGRSTGYVGAREMALHSSSKDRSDAIAAVRYTLSTLVTFHQLCYLCIFVFFCHSICHCF